MQQNYQIWILESDGRVHVRVDALPDCVGDGPEEVGRDGVAEQVRAEDLGGAGKASPRWHHDQLQFSSKPVGKKRVES